MNTKHRHKLNSLLTTTERSVAERQTSIRTSAYVDELTLREFEELSKCLLSWQTDMFSGIIRSSAAAACEELFHRAIEKENGE